MSVAISLAAPRSPHTVHHSPHARARCEELSRRRARGDHTSCTRSGGHASFTRSINTTVMTRLMLTNEFGAAIAVVVAGSAAANWFGASR